MSTYIYDMVATWTDSGTAYNAIKMNVTNTASASGSNLLNLLVDGSSKFKVAKDGVVTFTGNILAGTDNSYDIGASGANRPRTIYLGGSVIADGNLGAGSNGYVYWPSRGSIRFLSDGNMVIRNANDDNFGKLQFGGTSASFPALKRMDAVLGVRVADDSTGAALNFLEQTAPAAPSSDQVVLYAQDNGAGKTQLMARFPTGAAQQVAIEP